jgi:transcriptional regulator with XRE-family HTH domain
MPRCAKCQGEMVIDPTPLRSHTEVMGGIHVVLMDSVREMKCPNHPDVVFTEVPDLEGLRAAVAVKRVGVAEKLTGSELRFLRRVAGWKATELAEKINKSEEVISRWESGKQTIGESTERLLRLLVGLELREKTSVPFDPKLIAMLKIRPLRDVKRPVHILLQFNRREVVRLVAEAQATETRWLVDQTAAAM